MSPRTSARPLYLYAIIERRPLRALGSGVARRPLSLVRAGGAYVVTEQAAARAPTTAAIVAHDRVVRRIARASDAVLPLRFASTALDRAGIVALLASFEPALTRAFERVRGAVQLTLRVAGQATRPEIDARSGPGTRWLAERLARQSVPEIALLTEATAPWVREVRVERQETPPRLATVYHLVDRRHLRAWRSVVARAVPSLARQGIQVTATGPWPPYAFAELT